MGLCVILKPIELLRPTNRCIKKFLCHCSSPFTSVMIRKTMENSHAHKKKLQINNRGAIAYQSKHERSLILLRTVSQLNLMFKHLLCSFHIKLMIKRWTLNAIPIPWEFSMPHDNLRSMRIEIISLVVSLGEYKSLNYCVLCEHKWISDNNGVSFVMRMENRLLWSFRHNCKSYQEQFCLFMSAKMKRVLSSSFMTNCVCE